MPTIAQKAAAEAEAAEAEEQEDQPTEEQPAETDEELAELAEPDPADGLEEPTEAMMVELGAACNDHHDHVRQIMGSFVQGFEPCDECNGIGIAIPKPAGRQLKPRQGAAQCTVCDGEGELALPTKREQFAIEQCTNCNGRGWVGAGNMPAAGQVEQAVSTYPAGEQPAQPPIASSQQQSTDPRVLELQSEGFIVLPKPNA